MEDINLIIVSKMTGATYKCFYDLSGIYFNGMYPQVKIESFSKNEYVLVGANMVFYCYEKDETLRSEAAEKYLKDAGFIRA